MANKIIKITFLFIILASIFPIANAYTNYSTIGGVNNDFTAGTGFFNLEIVNTSIDTRSISQQQQTPLVVDMDGDGINEIIILDGSSFRLFKGQTLEIVDSIDLPSWSNFSEHIYFSTYDIDADGKTEILFADSQNEDLLIIEYNGTSMFTQATISLSSLTFDNGEIIFQCRAAEDCLIVYTEVNQNTVQITPGIYAAFFNSSAVGSELTVDTSTITGENFCFPKIRSLQVADIDNDAVNEYIFSAMEVESTADEDLHMYSIGVTGATPSLEAQATRTNVGSLIAGADNGANAIDCRRDLVGNMFSQALVFDIDGSTSNGLEMVIGTNLNANEFVMYSHESDGDPLDDYPETFEADGQIISNVFRANVFRDTTDVDFCVFGADPASSEIDLLCASEQTGETPETREFKSSTLGFHNISPGFKDWNVISHAAQHSTITSQGNNLDEIVNSYGVLTPNWDVIHTIQIGGNIYELDRIFANPKPDAVIIPVDAEKVGRDDFLILDNTNLWYLDDGFTNSKAAIASYTINPCLDSTWKENTTVSILITVEDVDGDNVNSTAILYEGHPNEQISTSVISASGSTFSHSFIANQTIGTANLRLIGQDTDNAEEDIIDLSFSVSSNGVELGDCSTEVSVTTVTDDEVEAGSDTIGGLTDTDALSTGTNALSTNFNLTPFLVFMLVMLFTTLGIVFSDFAHGNPLLGFLTIILTNIVLLIIGTKIGAIPAGIIITIVVIGVIIIGTWVAKAFITPSSN